MTRGNDDQLEESLMGLGEGLGNFRGGSSRFRDSKGSVKEHRSIDPVVRGSRKSSVR